MRVAHLEGLTSIGGTTEPTFDRRSRPLLLLNRPHATLRRCKRLDAILAVSSCVDRFSNHRRNCIYAQQDERRYEQSPWRLAGNTVLDATAR